MESSGTAEQAVCAFLLFCSERSLVTLRLTCLNWKKFKKGKGKSVIIMITFSKPKVETCCNVGSDQIVQFKAVLQILALVIEVLRVSIQFPNTYFSFLTLTFSCFQTCTWIRFFILVVSFTFELAVENHVAGLELGLRLRAAIPLHSGC